jgi:hypothetical protein
MTEISATWRYQMAHGYLPVHVMKGMIASGEFEKLNGYRMASHVYSRNFYIPFVTKNIYYNSKPQAHLFVINSMKRPCSRDIAVGQILGEFIEKHFFLLSEFNLNRIGSNHEAFFNDVLNGTCTDEIVIQRQLSLFDWSPSNDYCMAILDISSRDTGFQRTVMYELECATDLKCFVHESNLVVLQRNPDDKQKFFRRFLQNISRKYSLEICMGTVFSGFMKLKEQYQILTKVTGIVCRLGEHPLYYEAADYGMYYVVDHILHTSELYHLCDKRALLLQQFDFQHGTDYFATFLSYLLHDRNMVHTSQALHIHRNTLMYRLEKIQNLIFFDEDDPDEMGSQIVSPDAWQPEQKIHMLLSMILLDYEKKG